MNFNIMDTDIKKLKNTHIAALSLFFLSFFFELLNYLKFADLTSNIICSIASVISVIISLYFTSDVISASLMLNAVIMILNVSIFYWKFFAEAYRFFAALLILIILIVSMYKILKNK